MLIYSIDDDRGCREMIKKIIGRFSNASIHSFTNPFEAYIAIQDEIPDVVVVDYDYKGYRLPKGAFECLGKLRDTKVVLISGFDWDYICQDLDERNITLPKNVEFIKKGNLDILNRLKDLTRPKSFV